MAVAVAVAVSESELIAYFSENDTNRVNIYLPIEYTKSSHYSKAYIR